MPRLAYLLWSMLLAIALSACTQPAEDAQQETREEGAAVGLELMADGLTSP